MMERDEDTVVAPEAQPDDEVAESPTTEVPLDTQRFPRSFPPAQLEGLRAQDLATLQATDAALVEKGMHAFFNNDFRVAETLFASHYTEDCLVASAYGTLGTIRALLSMEQADVDEACQRLLFASNFAQQVSPPERMVTKTIAAVTSSVSSAFNKASGFLGSWGKPKADASTPTGVSPSSSATPTSTASTSIKRLTVAQFRAEVVHAESEVLRATLLLLQDSFAAYVKAGLALRRSYNAYARLQQYIQERTPEEEAALDRNSVEGVHFGLGCIHVVTSILPPKILAILKALGYMHNRDVGFDHLQRSLRSGTLRSPLASLFMLAFHGILPSFALVMIPDSLPTCAAVIAENQKQFPVSVIHLWLGGRVARLSRDCAKSMEVLDRCLDQGKHLMVDLPQLQHFALYDQAWNWCTTFDWLAAATAFEHLEKESNWSKKMFSYAQGCCYEMVAIACALHASSVSAHRRTGASIVPASFFDNSDSNISNAGVWASKASAAYLRAHSHAATRLGGKVISIDQFVGRRLNTMLERQGCAPSSPSSPVASTATIRNVVALSGFELLLVFNMLSQAPVASLNAIANATSVVGAMVLGRDEAAPWAACHPLLLSGGVAGEGAASDAHGSDVPPGMLLPSYRGETAVALLMLADCMRDGAGTCPPEARYQSADCIYSALADGNVFPSKGSEEVKWCAPFALYGRAMCRYWDAAIKQPTSADAVLQTELNALKQAYNRVDYHFEMQMQFRLHLTQDFLRHRAPSKATS